MAGQLLGKRDGIQYRALSVRRDRAVCGVDFPRSSGFEPTVPFFFASLSEFYSANVDSAAGFRGHEAMLESFQNINVDFCDQD